MKTILPPPSKEAHSTPVSSRDLRRHPLASRYPHREMWNPWPFKPNPIPRADALCKRILHVELDQPYRVDNEERPCAVCKKQTSRAQRLPIVSGTLLDHRRLRKNRSRMQGPYGTVFELTQSMFIETRSLCSMECYASALLREVHYPVGILQHLFSWFIYILLALPHLLTVLIKKYYY